MYQIDRLPAIPRRLTPTTVALSLPRWIRLALRKMADRNKARRDMCRLLERPHLARDVGLDMDRLHRELIRLRGRV